MSVPFVQMRSTTFSFLLSIVNRIFHRTLLCAHGFCKSRHAGTCQLSMRNDPTAQRLAPKDAKPLKSNRQFTPSLIQLSAISPNPPPPPPLPHALVNLLTCHPIRTQPERHP